MTDSRSAAVARIQAFLASRATTTGLDPEVIAAHNGHELLASDLRAILAPAYCRECGQHVGSWHLSSCSEYGTKVAAADPSQ